MIPRRWRGGRKKLAAYEAAVAAVIERHLDNYRCGGGKPTRGVYGES